MGRRERSRRVLREDPPPSPDLNGFSRRARRQEPELVVVKDMPGQEKMSEIILDLAKPLLEESEEFDWKLTALDLAIIAWNLSLAPEAEQQRLQREFPQMFGDPETRELFDLLLERKAELYPDNQRVIVDYEIRPKGSGHALRIISTPELPEG